MPGSACSLSLYVYATISMLLAAKFVGQILAQSHWGRFCKTVPQSAVVETRLSIKSMQG
jgi:hypothetical protein